MNYYEESSGWPEEDYIEGLFDLTDQELIDAHASAAQDGDLIKAHDAHIEMCSRLDSPDHNYPVGAGPDPMMKAYQAWIEMNTDPALLRALSTAVIMRACERAASRGCLPI